MDSIKIRGGAKLKGEVLVSGAKNSALKVLIAGLLTDQKCLFHNVPRLHDIFSAVSLLESMGARLERNGSSVEVDCGNITKTEAHYDVVRKMRASVLVLGPLLARFGNAKVSLPGGCAIGARPINFHLLALKKLGATVDLVGGYVVARAKKLTGAKISLEFPSVGATENILMAAALSEGESLIENAAKEPEIIDLAEVLSKMGVQIEGAGTASIKLQGRKQLTGCEHKVIGDRIEAGSYLAAGIATGGMVTVKGVEPSHLGVVLDKFEEAGSKVVRDLNSITVDATSQLRPKAASIITQPHPGFPTDMQAQFMALMCISDGTSVISENIFENRFMHVPELIRLGADILVRGKNATVVGKPKLKAAPLMATDLRASMSLIIAGLVAEGQTTVNRVYHLDRGYESVEEKFRGLGADIERVRS